MYYVTAVRTVHPAGYAHPHISEVRLSNGVTETRAEVIRYILRGVTYVTWAANVPEAKVIVAGCPLCGTGDYITTEPDWTTQNNLLDLPRF